jgi:hypothetical protein
MAGIKCTKTMCELVLHILLKKNFILDLCVAAPLTAYCHSVGSCIFTYM